MLALEIARRRLSYDEQLAAPGLPATGNLGRALGNQSHDQSEEAAQRTVREALADAFTAAQARHDKFWAFAAFFGSLRLGLRVSLLCASQGVAAPDQAAGRHALMSARLQCRALAGRRRRPPGRRGLVRRTLQRDRDPCCLPTAAAVLASDRGSRRDLHGSRLPGLSADAAATLLGTGALLVPPAPAALCPRPPRRHRRRVWLRYGFHAQGVARFRSRALVAASGYRRPVAAMHQGARHGHARPSLPSHKHAGQAAQTAAGRLPLQTAPCMRPRRPCICLRSTAALCSP
jgi:hypothetical protein